MYKNGIPKPSFFRDRNGLSCDLARFSTPERSRRGYADAPWPEEAGLVEFRARDVRDARSDVQHTPLKKPNWPFRNYAHCILNPNPPTEGIDHLTRVCTWRIPQRVR